MKRIVKCCLAVALGFVIAGCSKGSPQGFGSGGSSSGGGEHEKVQLWEDGPYWAETNVGAEKPWESGYYFWWGDTIGYKRVDDAWVASDGSSSRFSFDGRHAPTWGKNRESLRKEGWIIVEGILAPSHDAAHVQWGGKWRMPTEGELHDLCDKCDWTWASMNGVTGCVVRGRGKYASSSIFLPAAGSGYGTSLSFVGSYGHYRSSLPDSDPYNNHYAWYLYFYLISHSSGHGMNNDDRRCHGMSVRPVQGRISVFYRQKR